MPAPPRLPGETPALVLDAIEALGSELRVRLIQHYLGHPGSQVAAAEALQLPGPTVTRNTQRLLRRGVVEASLDPVNSSTRIYRVNHERLRTLLVALDDFFDLPSRSI